MEAIFISRKLEEESPIKQLAQEVGLPVFDESLVAFRPIRFAAIPTVDWVFFSSPRAVIFFFRGLLQQGLTLPHSVKIGVIGHGTGKALKEFGRPPDFSGNGNPTTIGNSFRYLVTNQHVLFPGARQSRRSIQQCMDASTKVSDLVVYDNDIRLDHEVPNCSYLLFTSPLNVDCWSRTHGFTNAKICVAIGPTTGEALRSKHIIPWIADMPSEIGMEALLRQHFL